MVAIRSDQGAKFNNRDRQGLLKEYRLVASVSRRRNCCDYAVAESFFWLLKRERIHKKIYLTREEAPEDIFNNIEMFCKSKRRHGHANNVWLVQFDQRCFNRLNYV